jgi:Family of unknown function (DUF6338)
MTSVEAAALFVLLIGPGYVYLRSYNRLRREVAVATAPALADLAQPVVASVFLVGLTWWPISGALIGRLDTLQTNFDAVADKSTWLLIIALFGIAVASGALLGAAVRWAGELPPNSDKQPQRSLRALFNALGLYEARTLWDQMAKRLQAADATLLRLRLKDGAWVHGTFADGSQMDVAPSPPAIFLEEAWYKADAQAPLEQAPEGAYLEACDIVSLEILKTS